MPIWASKRLTWRAKFDLSVYLLMILFILIVFAGLVISLLGYAGVLDPINSSLNFISDRFLHNLAELGLSVGPLAAFVAVYQVRAASPLRWWELPVVAVLFAAYAYFFVISQIWAWTRIVARRGSWAKTPRVSADIAVPIGF